MIQRIQSIYLFIAGLGFLSHFGTDLAGSNVPVQQLLADRIYEIQDSPILIGLTVLGALLAIGAIFIYKNRGLQQKMSIFVVICSLFLPLVAFLLVYNEGATDMVGLEIEDKAGLYLCAVPLIFGILAYRGINKDDKLVKSMDRLR